ncbi:hypothetical protein [Nocardia sp. NPDC050793]|uniref:hypothetical protein n=1 Tax=Nocardia sp. NPDC050793 TaxID=3155159 RepID=UPI0033CAA79F
MTIALLHRTEARQRLVRDDGFVHRLDHRRMDRTGHLMADSSAMIGHPCVP